VNLPLVLAGTKHLLLDFDGPMCSTFSAISSATATRELGDLLNQHDLRVPAYLLDTADPFALLYYVAANAPHLADTAEQALTGLEVVGVKTAQPTPGLYELLTVLTHTGRTVTVVSNNSEAAVGAFLDREYLGRFFHGIAARIDPDPRLLKPDPHLLRRAADGLGATLSACTLLGDSATDVEAAHRAGIRSIAYANRPDKRDGLLSMRPDALVSSLHDVTAVLA
jgi:HAD superfamily hydrolase (TIGR01509 family)